VAAKTADEALTSRLLTEAHSPSLNAQYVEGIMTCLGQIKRPEVVDSLISLLKHTSPALRQNAAGALGLQGDPRAIQPLAEAIGDPECKVRSEAVRALGDMKNPAVLAPLERALRDSIYDVRRSAVCALCDLGDPRAIPLLQRQIRRESLPHVKEWIAKRLRDLPARPIGSESKAHAGKPQSAWWNVARWFK
jgi:HEAT repeat protein